MFHFELASFSTFIRLRKKIVEKRGLGKITNPALFLAYVFKQKLRGWIQKSFQNCLKSTIWSLINRQNSTVWVARDETSNEKKTFHLKFHLGSWRWSWKFRKKHFKNPNPEFLLHSNNSFWSQLSTSGSGWDLARKSHEKCEKRLLSLNRCNWSIA